MDNLLDTHTFIWFIEGDDRLSEKARGSIEAEDTKNFVSIASLWEIAIKVSLGNWTSKFLLPEFSSKSLKRVSAITRCF